MPNVSKARLRGLEIILPRLEEQKKFARILQRHHGLRKNHVQSQTQADMLFSSFQSYAFSGQL